MSRGIVDAVIDLEGVPSEVAHQEFVLDAHKSGLAFAALGYEACRSGIKGRIVDGDDERDVIDCGAFIFDDPPPGNPVSIGVRLLEGLQAIVDLWVIRTCPRKRRIDSTVWRAGPGLC